MSDTTTFRTAIPEIVETFQQWQRDVVAVNTRRAALIDSIGRNAYIQGAGGYSTQIIGFERFDSDKGGDRLHHHDCLIVSSKRGANAGRIVPNMRRKAGQEFAAELRREYTTPDLDLPGLPTMHVYSSGLGLVMGRASVWVHDGVVYALWQCSDAPMGEEWEPIPLSTYFLAHEAYEAAEQAAQTEDEEQSGE